MNLGAGKALAMCKLSADGPSVDGVTLEPIDAGWKDTNSASSVFLAGVNSNGPPHIQGVPLLLQGTRWPRAEGWQMKEGIHPEGHPVLMKEA